jgi:hypothetical protein
MDATSLLRHFLSAFSPHQKSRRPKLSLRRRRSMSVAEVTHISARIAGFHSPTAARNQHTT